jgi:hypothetical protein
MIGSGRQGQAHCFQQMGECGLPPRQKICSPFFEEESPENEPAHVGFSLEKEPNMRVLPIGGIDLSLTIMVGDAGGA